MRDVKQVVGVSALLVALPAWASQMGALGDLLLVMFLTPVYLVAIAACFVGLLVRSPKAARVWAVLLLGLAVPAFGVAGFFLFIFLDSGGVAPSAAFAIAVLVASYAWAGWRIAVSIRQPQGTPEGSPSSVVAPRPQSG